MQTYLTPKDMDGKSNTWDVIVIGSGMGGLASASALSHYGRRVLLLEQHYTPGGFTHTFTRKGYEWDVGVHCIGEVGPRRVVGRMFDFLSDGKIKWAPFGEVFDTFHFPDQTDYEFPNTKQKFIANLHRYFPDETKAIDEYFRLVDEVKKSVRTYFVTQTLPNWAETILEKVGFGAHVWRRRTTREVLNSIGASPKLQTLLTAQWGYYGEPPADSSFAIHALTFQHFYSGGYFPVGGASSISREIIKTLQKNQGEVLVRADVQEIILKNGRAVGVRLKTGQEFFAKRIISAVGAQNTVRALLPQKYHTTSWGKGILDLKMSPPHLCLYIGMEGDVENAGATKSSQWFYPSWNTDEKYWNLAKLDHPPILFVSFPSVKNPEHPKTTPMKHTAEVVTFVDWKAFEQWSDSRRGNRKPDYMEFKKKIEDALLEQFKKQFPKLAPLIKHHELSTPLSTTFFDRAPQGGIYGLEHTPKRFLSPHLRVRTPIKGLYLSGQDVSTGGVAGALTGGLLAAATIDPRVFKTLT